MSVVRRSVGEAGAPQPELVVLVDESGNAVGTAPKRGVHHQHTPLHLAFSCYVFDPGSRLLLTRRAVGKLTWPGVWTNSFCGHPGPGEDILEAVNRRAREELGVELRRLSLALPSFRYQAVMANGVRENELCPVFTAVTSDPVRPDADEVEEFEWVDWPTFRTEVLARERDVSPWCTEQVAHLSPDAPSSGDAGPDLSALPAAARP